MRKALALVFLLALAAPAFAADNTLLVTPCASGCITTKSKDVGAGVEAPQPILSDTSGNTLATPSAGADTVSNSTEGLQVHGFPYWYNGTTWDRARGDATNGAFVNVKTSVLPTGGATSANQATEISSLATIVTNTGAAIPAGTNVIGHVIVDTAPSTAVTNAGTFATQATSQATTNRIGYVTDDPCSNVTKTNLAIATSSGTVQLVAPSGSTQVYVCSFSLIAASTAVVNLVGGTGATCTTGTPVAALGSTTAASGASLAANGGLTFGNGGATVARTTTAGHGLCLIQSGTTALAGNITYVQQ